MLRTGFKTPEQQEQFYRDTICRPYNWHQYYAVESDGAFVGMGGLTYIDWLEADGEAEISLILGPESRGCGIGAAAVDALIEEAKRLGLNYLVGECYAEGNIGFWTQQIRRIPAFVEWRWSLR